jgi:hypothetical protein
MFGSKHYFLFLTTLISHHRVDRVLGFFYSRPNWDSRTPSPAGECVPPSFSSGGEGGAEPSGRVALLLLLSLLQLRKPECIIIRAAVGDANRGIFSNFFSLCTIFNTASSGAPVGGCWNRTQDCCDFGIGSQTL